MWKGSSIGGVGTGGMGARALLQSSGGKVEKRKEKSGKREERGRKKRMTKEDICTDHLLPTPSS